jgi:TRAP-type C4-dicarboxylate transport system substrate-binding protein
MKKLSLLLVLALVIAVVGSAMACSDNSDNDKVTILRLAVPWPQGDPATNEIDIFVKDFNEKAAGKYEIQIHPGESQVKTNDSLDALRNGAVELGGWPTGLFGSMDPVFAIAEMPFLANNAEADAAMQTDTIKIYDKVMTEKFNMKPLFSFTCLGLDVVSVKPLHTKADWKGVLVQSVSPQSAKFIELMGGSSVPMPFADGYQGLQKKTIEASMQSSSMMIMFNMNEVATDVLRGYLIPASLMVSVNLETFNKMPKDYQDILLKCGSDAQKVINAYFVNVAAEIPPL